MSTLKQITTKIVVNTFLSCGLSQTITAKQLDITRNTVRKFLMIYLGGFLPNSDSKLSTSVMEKYLVNQKAEREYETY